MNTQVHTGEPDGGNHHAQERGQSDACTTIAHVAPGEPDEQPEERHGRHGVAGRKAKAADLDQTQGDIGGRWIVNFSSWLRMVDPARLTVQNQPRPFRPRERPASVTGICRRKAAPA